MRKLLFLAVMLCLAFSVGCRPGKSIQTVSGSVSTMGQTKLSTDDVRRAISSACLARGWQARELSPGLIEARLLVRGKHTVVVDIPYSADTYTIKYKSSSNMEYKTKSDGSQYIHPNYNKWVNLLHNDINAELARVVK